jgi:hypothetical protein
MMMEEERADAYREMTGTRHLDRRTPDTVRRHQRVKPDPETNPLADIDWEKEPPHVESPPEPTRREGCTCARR